MKCFSRALIGFVLGMLLSTPAIAESISGYAFTCNTGRLCLSQFPSLNLYTPNELATTASGTQTGTAIITVTGTGTNTASQALTALATMTGTYSSTATSSDTSTGTFSQTKASSIYGTPTFTYTESLTITGTVTLSSTNTHYNTSTLTASQTFGGAQTFSKTATEFQTLTQTYTRTATGTGTRTWTSTGTITFLEGYIGTKTETGPTATGVLTGTGTLTVTSTVTATTIVSSPTLLNAMRYPGGDMFFHNQSECPTPALTRRPSDEGCNPFTAAPTPGSPASFGVFCPFVESVFSGPRGGWVSDGHYHVTLFLKTTSTAYVTVDFIGYDAGTHVETDLSAAFPESHMQTMLFDNASFVAFKFLVSRYGSDAAPGMEFVNPPLMCVRVTAYTVSGTPTVQLASGLASEGSVASSINWPIIQYQAE